MRPPAGRPWLARLNPLAKFAAAFLVTAGLIPVLDPVTAGVVLVAAAALLPVSGLGVRALVTLGGSLFLMSVSIGTINLVFGDEGALPALGTAVRLLAIALPSVLAGMTSDPTEVADALVQKLRLPERPALGVLAALRLVPLLAGQWRTLGLARRARGVESGGNPIAAVGIFAGKAFALLVRAIRTGTHLAAAMEARAFGSGGRSHARTSRWTAADTCLLVGTAAVLFLAHGLSMYLGTWRLLFG
ncbi:energy-coupling factor transport system permease protein [Haloactinospora alba]|uniref:Energy-coupling factor transport system permease protein n=1 Tax=Haloactinospora alba TaxID=405555 RepID=A0A543NG74_9ACTN|nr:energy-coupling factor transporter transmembrane component T [Haloactinospora alba]TQN30846.1 energy-coupling factor transport system permease protein [Haloactinospora alba]